MPKFLRANQCLDLSGIRKFCVVGVLGPSVHYASTGTDLRTALRSIYRGKQIEDQILNGFDLVLSQLSSHTEQWTEYRKAEYRERHGLLSKSKPRPTTPVKTRKFASRPVIKPRTKSRSVKPHRSIKTSTRGCLLSPPRDLVSSDESHADSQDPSTGASGKLSCPIFFGAGIELVVGEGGSLRPDDSVSNLTTMDGHPASEQELGDAWHNHGEDLSSHYPLTRSPVGDRNARCGPTGSHHIQACIQDVSSPAHPPAPSRPSTRAVIVETRMELGGQPAAFRS